MEWEQSFVIMSDDDPMKEEKLRSMPIYDFYFRIFTMKKNAQKSSSTLSNEPFGLDR